MQRVVKIIDATVPQQKTTHQKNLFGRIGDEATQDDRWHRAFALLAQNIRGLVHARGSAYENGFLPLADRWAERQWTRWAQFVARRPYQRANGLRRRNPAEGRQKSNGGS